MKMHANKDAADCKHLHKPNSLGLGSIEQIHCYYCTSSLGRVLTSFNLKFLHHCENFKFRN